MSARLPTRLLRAAALVALGACAGLPARYATRDPALLSDDTAPRPRECSVVQVPARLPTAESLVDTGALKAAVAELRGTAPVGPGYVLLSMGYAPDGINVRRTVIEHSVAPVVADTLQKLVFAHRRVLPRADAEWGVRLRIDLDERLRFRVGRRELCTPRPRDPGLLARGSVLDPLPPPSATTRTVWVRIWVDALGRVTDARVERGLLPRGAQESRLLEYVRTLSFDPATDDGRPVPSEATLPVRVDG